MNREKIGLKDINGVEICEGYELLVYEQRFKCTKVESLGSIPVYEEDCSKPLPSPDVVLARGKVYWDTTMLAWMLRLDWTTPSFGVSFGCIHIGGMMYGYEVLMEEGEI